MPAAKPSENMQPSVFHVEDVEEDEGKLINSSSLFFYIRMSEYCRLCGTTRNLEYCGMCKKSFCLNCKRKYPQRVHAMMQEKVFDPIGDFIDGVQRFFSA